MDKMEGKSLDYKPFTLLQYIDNIFFIWTHAENKLKTFLENYNQFHPNIKLTRKSSAESIFFSDVSGKLSQRKLETGLHITHTDKHQYLHYFFSNIGLRSIVYSQTLRG